MHGFVSLSLPLSPSRFSHRHALTIKLIKFSHIIIILLRSIKTKWIRLIRCFISRYTRFLSILLHTDVSLPNCKYTKSYDILSMSSKFEVIVDLCVCVKFNFCHFRIRAHNIMLSFYLRWHTLIGAACTMYTKSERTLAYSFVVNAILVFINII